MANRQGITPVFTDSGLPRLYRSHAVEQHAIQSEIQTLVIIAGYACDFLTEGLEVPPEDFFTCIEEMKEVMESIGLKVWILKSGRSRFRGRNGVWRPRRPVRIVKRRFDHEQQNFVRTKNGRCRPRGHHRTVAASHGRRDSRYRRVEPDPADFAGSAHA